MHCLIKPPTPQFAIFSPLEFDEHQLSSRHSWTCRCSMTSMRQSDDQLFHNFVKCCSNCSHCAVEIRASLHEQAPFSKPCTLLPPTCKPQFISRDSWSSHVTRPHLVLLWQSLKPHSYKDFSFRQHVSRPNSGPRPTSISLHGPQESASLPVLFTHIASQHQLDKSTAQSHARPPNKSLLCDPTHPSHSCRQPGSGSVP